MIYIFVFNSYDYREDSAYSSTTSRPHLSFIALQAEALLSNGQPQRTLTFQERGVRPPPDQFHYQEQSCFVPVPVGGRSRKDGGLLPFRQIEKLFFRATEETR